MLRDKGIQCLRRHEPFVDGHRGAIRKGFLTARKKGIRTAENFLCGGSAALLIAVVHLYQDLWWLSLVALAPFLYRAVKADLSDSFALGAFLAISYCFVAVPAHPLLEPGQLLAKFLALNLLFILYAVAINRIGNRIGFNAVFIAALWLPLEYALSHYAGFSNIFTFSSTDSSFGYRLASLFGLLMISFVVMLVNTLTLILFKRVVEALRSKVACSVKVLRETHLPFEEILLERCWYYFPHRRAPPVP